MYNHEKPWVIELVKGFCRTFVVDGIVMAKLKPEVVAEIVI